MSVQIRSAQSMRWMLFVVLAIAGLAYVKWLPYYQRAFVAASQHSIGHSILGTESANAVSPLDAALNYAWAYGKAIWQAMVLGLLLGSGIQALLPSNAIQRFLGRTRFQSVLAGGLISIPGMMCTCCAAPVVAGLRKSAATPGAAVAFWLGNTLFNPATLIFTGFVLGWNWTLLRIVFSVPLVFGLGLLADRLTKGSPSVPFELPAMEEPQSWQAVVDRWWRAFARMAIGLIPEYIVLVLLLGAAHAWMFPHGTVTVTDPAFWIVGMALVGTFFVIPTAGEVPIVQAMLALGLGAGPAAALLMTLPPVSAPSLAMLWRSFSPRVLLVVALMVFLTGILASVAATALSVH